MCVAPCDETSKLGSLRGRCLRHAEFYPRAGRTMPKLPAAVDRWDRTRAKCMTRPETISGVIGCRDRWHGIARHRPGVTAPIRKYAADSRGFAADSRRIREDLRTDSQGFATDSREFAAEFARIRNGFARVRDRFAIVRDQVCKDSREFAMDSKGFATNS